MESSGENRGVTYNIGDDPRNPDFVIGWEMPSDEHLIAMGRVTVAFTQLEDLVSTCFSLVLGCEPELGGIVANSLGMRERCDSLFHVFAYRFGCADTIRSGADPKKAKRLRELSRLFDRIQKASSTRNTVVHSTWSVAEEEEGKAHRLSWSRSRRQPGFPSSDYDLLSAEEILKQADFIMEVRQELYLFFWKHFGAWAQERARRGEGGMQLL